MATRSTLRWPSRRAPAQGALFRAPARRGLDRKPARKAAQPPICLPFMDRLACACGWNWSSARFRAGNYDQLWLTTSLRGMSALRGTSSPRACTREIQRRGPRPRAALRQLLTGWKTAPAALCPPASNCEVPGRPTDPGCARPPASWVTKSPTIPWAHADCGGASSSVLGHDGRPGRGLLNRTWRPTLSVIGADGFPRWSPMPEMRGPTHGVQRQPAAAAPAGSRRAVQEPQTLLGKTTRPRPRHV